MNLIIGLAAVDQVNGERQMRQLADGWMGGESKRGRRLRELAARGLLALATRLAPADLRATLTNRTANPAVAA